MKVINTTWLTHLNVWNYVMNILRNLKVIFISWITQFPVRNSMITILWIIKVYKSACMKLYDNYSMYFKVIISTELHIYLSETLWKSFYGFQKYAFCMAYTTTCLKLYDKYSMDYKSYLYRPARLTWSQTMHTQI